MFGHIVDLNSDADGRHDKAFHTLAVRRSKVPGLALHDGLQTEDGITTTCDRRHIDKRDRTHVGTHGRKVGDTVVNGPTLSALANLSGCLLAKVPLDPCDKYYGCTSFSLH